MISDGALLIRFSHVNKVFSDIRFKEWTAQDVLYMQDSRIVQLSLKSGIVD